MLYYSAQLSFFLRFSLIPRHFFLRPARVVFTSLISKSHTAATRREEAPGTPVLARLPTAANSKRTLINLRETKLQKRRLIEPEARAPRRCYFLSAPR